jgi:molecular chaperone HtpG
VIDSPDIPLNVSRSGLQADCCEKISNLYYRKVADKLKSLFTENVDFEKNGMILKSF